MPPAEKINLLKDYLNKVDEWSAGFSKEIQRIVDRHKVEGGNLEYVYVEHFHQEMQGLSALFQYLLKDLENKKYVFFPVRASIEVLLYLEHVLKLANLDDNKVLELLSTDLAQSATAINDAAPTNEDNLMDLNVRRIGVVNKILNTTFDQAKIKPNTKPFPDVRTLCNESALTLKDFKGSAMYHIYRLYSESNHLRLSNSYSISKELDVDICWALEYFIEIYIKFYEQILAAEDFPQESSSSLAKIKGPLGLK